MKNYIAIDVGGTAIKYGLIDGNGNLLEARSMPTESWKGGQAILDKVRGIVRAYRKNESQKEPAEKEDRIAGICLSSAGMVDVEEGRIFFSGPTIPDYTGTRFKETLEEEFHLPCEVENDVNCAGLAEALVGAGREYETVLCLTVGTGIGGCFVEHGQVWHGHTGSALEIGYMHLPGGVFQDLGSTSTLMKKVDARKGTDGGRWTGRRIFEAARRGDRVCIQAIDQMCDTLGMGIANLCYTLNPAVVVLGGGVMAQEEYLKPRIRAALDADLLPVIAENTALAMARCGNHAGMIGAFYHFQRMSEKRGRTAQSE